MDLDEILRAAIERDVSDIHLKVGSKPLFRRYGRLGPDETLSEVGPADMDGFITGLSDAPQRERLARERQLDLGYGNESLGRFRVNIYHQRGEPRIAMRLIPQRVKSLDQLNLPAIVRALASESRGLVLVTGTTGSGKSTTLAAMIDELNHREALHIVTVEDPIEYLHRDDRSMISQREVGVDVMNFADGLRGALRQDPDAILIGEMRDLETIETAILSAETGHLVMSTLHTLDAPETVTRIIQAFPDHQRDQMRLVLSSVLKGIVSQRLVPRADGQGLVPAVEVLVNTALVREIIKDPTRSPRELTDALARGHVTYGTQTFDQSLMGLYRSELITYEEALVQATNPDDFALQVRGVTSTSDARWVDFDRPANDSGTPLSGAAGAPGAGGAAGAGGPFQRPGRNPEAPPAAGRAASPRLVRRF